MKTIEILLEQENITNARQLANSFTHEEWFNIANNLARRRLEQTTSADARVSIREKFLADLGRSPNGAMTNASNPADWYDRASRYNIRININDLTWNDIKEFLSQHTQQSTLTPIIPDDQSDRNPYSQNREEILALYPSTAPSEYTNKEDLSRDLRAFYNAFKDYKNERYPGYLAIFDNTNGDVWKTAESQYNIWVGNIERELIGSVQTNAIKNWLIGWAETSDRVILPILDRQN